MKLLNKKFHQEKLREQARPGDLACRLAVHDTSKLPGNLRAHGTERREVLCRLA
jgi:hypothetical protein